MDQSDIAMNALNRVQLISRENTAITTSMILMAFAHGGLTELSVQYIEGNILSRLGRGAQESAGQNDDQAMILGLDSLFKDCRHKVFSGKAAMTIMFDAGSTTGWTIIKTLTFGCSGRKIALAHDI